VKLETIALPIVRLALAEDLGAGDVTTESLVSPSARARARIEAGATGVLAGIDLARLVFHELDRDVDFRPQAKDGARLKPGQTVATIEGRARAVLSGERVALNLLQHLSGIATATARFVDALKGTPAQVRDTRKTFPGLRVLEKYAVLVGGGHNHRFGLFDMVLIKDNHLPAAGSITGAVRAARRAHPDLLIQVEVRNADEAEEAVSAGADQLLLDNMDPSLVRATLERIGIAPDEPPRAAGRPGRPWIEVSGGVTLENVRSFALPGVDSVAVGAITHSAPALDLALTVDSIEDYA
jgi:nicotinate-nucleotide pyrophosphorylase (carboxylating)